MGDDSATIESGLAVDKVVSIVNELQAVNAWQGRRIIRLIRFAQWVCDHSNDPAIISEAQAALTETDKLDA